MTIPKKGHSSISCPTCSFRTLLLPHQEVESRGVWLARSVEYANLGLGVISSSPTLRVEPTLKKKWSLFPTLYDYLNTECGEKEALGFMRLGHERQYCFQQPPSLSLDTWPWNSATICEEAQATWGRAG